MTPLYRRPKNKSQSIAASPPPPSARLLGMDKPTKITFAELRELGVRGVLIYCADCQCSHSIAVMADQWADDLRLSDIEDRFKARPGLRANPYAAGKAAALARLPILFRRLIEEARAKGYKNLRITTGAENHAMPALARLLSRQPAGRMHDIRPGSRRV